MRFCNNCGNDVSESSVETCEKCGFSLHSPKKETFIASFIDMWKNSLNFGGRTSRRSFWMAFPIYLILYWIVQGIIAMGTPTFIAMLFALVIGIPFFSMQVRRLRDADQFWFWVFAPIVNIVLLCLPTGYKAKKSIAGIVLMGIGIVLFLVAFLAWGDYSYIAESDETTALVVLGLSLILYIITLASYIQGKSWSLVISVINLTFLNLSTLYHLYLSLQARGAGLDVNIWLGVTYLLIVYVSTLATIDSIACLSKVADEERKVFWLKLNAIPTERDNTLFKLGCAVASIVMGMSLTMPFFSVNIHHFSANISFFDVFRGLSAFQNFMSIRLADDVAGIMLFPLVMLIFHIIVLFIVSFAKSKAVKTTIGITTAISIAAIVFGTQTVLFNSLESLVGNIPFAERLGLVGFITNSIGNVFTSIFRLEIGVWVLLGSLAMYIIFASCQLSNIRKPAIPTGQLSFPQATQVIKVRCIECGSITDENSAFCNSCGMQMAKEKPKDTSSSASECAGCGAKLNASMKFCNECGKAVL